MRTRARRLAPLIEPRRWFTHDQALAAMVFLRPVIDDFEQAFQRAVECHARLRLAVLKEHIAELVATQVEAIARFDRALEEIELTGAEVLGCRNCVVAFPTRCAGKGARLIWVRGADGLEQISAAAWELAAATIREPAWKINTC